MSKLGEFDEVGTVGTPSVVVKVGRVGKVDTDYLGLHLRTFASEAEAIAARQQAVHSDKHVAGFR